MTIITEEKVGRYEAAIRAWAMHDEMANAALHKVDEQRLIYITSVFTDIGFKKADAVIILNNNKKYNDINIFKMLNSMNKPGVFIDTWHIFDPAEIKKVKGVVYGGHGND